MYSSSAISGACDRRVNSQKLYHNHLLHAHSRRDKSGVISVCQFISTLRYVTFYSYTKLNFFSNLNNTLEKSGDRYEVSSWPQSPWSKPPSDPTRHSNDHDFLKSILQCDGLLLNLSQRKESTKAVDISVLSLLYC